MALNFTENSNDMIDFGKSLSQTDNMTSLILLYFTGGNSQNNGIIQLGPWEATGYTEFTKRKGGDAGKLQLQVAYSTTNNIAKSDSSNKLPADQWVWVAMQNDNKQPKIFIWNPGSAAAEVGGYDLQTTGVGTISPSTLDSVLGNLSDTSTSRSFGGYIGYFAHFTSVLSLDEMTEFSKRPRDVKGDGSCEVLMRIGAINSTTAVQRDTSGNGNDGTPSGVGGWIDSRPTGWGPMYRFKNKRTSASTASTGGGRTATATVTLPSLGVTSAAEVPVDATAVVTLPSLGVTATAEVPVDAQATVVLPSLEVTSLAGVEAKATAPNVGLPSLGVTATGTVTDGPEAQAQVVLPSLGVTALAEVEAQAQATVVLPSLGVTAVAGLGSGLATAQVVLPALGVSATAKAEIDATAQVVLPALGASATASVEVKAIASVLFPPLMVSATGSVTSELFANAAIALPPLGVSSIGTVSLPAMLSIYSVTGQTGANTGSSVTVNRVSPEGKAQGPVLFQILIGAGTATIEIEGSLDGGTTWQAVPSGNGLNATGMHLLECPPMVRVRLSAATGADVDVWMDAEKVSTRVDN
jgi:hypothetical protein